MKIVGIMLSRGNGWILGLSARVALKWCDTLIIHDKGSLGNTEQVVHELLASEQNRIKLMETRDPGEESASDYNVMLELARSERATHIAFLNPEEALSSNLLPAIRQHIQFLELGQMLELPMIACWKSFKKYRNDKSPWSTVDQPIAFRDSPSIHWRESSSNKDEIYPQGIVWGSFRPISRVKGGILNLERVNWRNFRAKHHLRRMRESLKWLGDGEIEKANHRFKALLDEAGIKLSKIPASWWTEYLDLFEYVLMSGKSWYESEATKLWSENDAMLFEGIEVPGEVITVPEEHFNPQAELREPMAPEAEVVTLLKPDGLRSVGPKIDAHREGKKPVETPEQRLRMLSWSGHFYDYSGYGKANREFLFRVANTFQVSLDQNELALEPVLIGQHMKSRIDVHRSIFPKSHCPYLRFFGPRQEKHKGHKICFTMMETYGTHPDLVSLLNGYDEIWVPTQWNKQIFENSGVTPPIMTMPLGVNPHIYYPGLKRELPPCRLLTTSRAGEREVPKGFLFVNVSNPSFRKGIDIIIRSFEDAFSENPDVSLILCVSYSSLIHCDPFMLIKSGREGCRSKVYVLEGMMNEEEMAQVYRSCDAYVTASRGEGWNLPLQEGAACGLPVIAPLAFSHHEFLNRDNSFLFEPDGFLEIHGSEKISSWYTGQLFAHYDQKAIDTLTEQMKRVHEDKEIAARKAELFRKEILEKYTWDKVSILFVSRLIELMDR